MTPGQKKFLASAGMLPVLLEIETISTTWSCADRGGGDGNRIRRSVERLTAKRRMILVVSLLKSETSVGEAAWKHGLTVAEVEDWREKFLLGAENALRGRLRDEEALKDEQGKKLKRKIVD